MALPVNQNNTHADRQNNAADACCNGAVLTGRFDRPVTMPMTGR